jgi:hypothetical protein
VLRELRRASSGKVEWIRSILEAVQASAVAATSGSPYSEAWLVGETKLFQAPVELDRMSERRLLWRTLKRYIRLREVAQDQQAQASLDKMLGIPDVHTLANARGRLTTWDWHRHSVLPQPLGWCAHWFLWRSEPSA